MSKIEKSYWQEVIEMLKTETMYKHLHLWYSSKCGWCYVSYKAERVRIDCIQTLFEIRNVLAQLK